MQVTVTFDPTQKAVTASDIAKVLRAQADALMSGSTQSDEAEAPTKKTRGKKAKPEATVSEEEEEEFGTKGALDEEELEEEEESEEEESEEEESGLDWDELKAAINKYGEKKPEDMKAILLGFNMKSTKELEKHKNKWEPVYRKVMVKLKAMKKAK